MNVKKTLLIIAFVFLVGLTCQQLLATWPCPCYTITCDNHILKFRFCLPENSHWILYYKPPDASEWQHLNLAIKAEVHDCPESCLYYGADIPGWDCSKVPVWYVSDGEGGEIEIDSSGDPCQ
jgi:hypothetical protein